MRIKNIIIDIIVFILLLVMLYLLNIIFINKDINYYTYINYKQQEKNSEDILIMGSSHAMNGFDAEDFDAIFARKNHEVKSFNLSITGMRFETMDYKLKEALKTQKPKVLIIETFSATPGELSNVEISRRYVLDYMPLTFNKLEFINKYIDEDKYSYIYPFIKYHTRWNELTKEDFEALNVKALKQKSKEYGLKTYTEDVAWEEDDGYFLTDYSECYEIEELSDEIDEALCNVLETAKKNNIKVLLVCMPYKVQMGYSSDHIVKNNNYIKDKYCDDENVFLLDLNRSYLDLNWNYSYMQDEGHLNKFGRDLVMPVIADYINTEMKVF